MRCFRSAKDDDGIKICLSCMQGYCSTAFDHYKHHVDQKNHPIYLHLKQVAIKTEQEMKDQDITKVAIGKEGGATYQVEYETITSLGCSICQKELDKTGNWIAPIVDSVVMSNSAFFQSNVGEWE